MVCENINVSKKDLCERSKIPIGSFDYIMGCCFTTFKSDVSKKYRFKIVNTKQRILDAALSLSEIDNYTNIKRVEVAKISRLNIRTVQRYFPTLEILHCKTLMHAIKNENAQVIAQGIANNDPITYNIAQTLRNKAAQYIMVGVKN